MAKAAKTLLPAETCVFGDVLEVWGEPSSVRKHFEGLDYSKQIALARTLPCQERAWCSTHGKFCPLANPSSRGHGSRGLRAQIGQMLA